MTGGRCLSVEDQFTTKTRRHGIGGGQRQDAKAQRRQESQRLTSPFAPLRLRVLALNSPLFSVPPCLRGKYRTLAGSPNLVLGKRGEQP
jgi:hypothetical protein